MITLFFTALIDTGILVFLLSVINEDQISFGVAFLVAIVTSIGTGILAAILGSVMGLVGVLLAAVIAAALLGVAVAALFGVEMKRAMLIGSLFIGLHICVALGIQVMISV